MLLTFIYAKRLRAGRASPQSQRCPPAATGAWRHLCPGRRGPAGGPTCCPPGPGSGGAPRDRLLPGGVSAGERRCPRPSRRGGIAACVCRLLRSRALAIGATVVHDSNYNHPSRKWHFSPCRPPHREPRLQPRLSDGDSSSAVKAALPGANPNGSASPLIIITQLK